ncbi:MAG: glycosyltransferase family 4 protein, partial [Thermoleophilia bacterium]|nr:glycosyltransferase family 4 protein [Thermoleophilia bacterium]
ELERAGCTVEVLAPGKGYDDHGLAYGAGIVANAKRRPWKVPLMLFSMWRNLRRAARHADVVHVHWLLVAPVAWAARVPFALTLHGSPSAGRFEDLELAKRHPRIFRWLVTRARIVIGVSKPLADAAANAGANAVVIPHGVHVPEPRTEPTGTPIALFAGRLAPEKGVHILAEAMEQVDGVELQIAGDGPLRHLFPQAMGFVPHDELHELYAKASMLVLPSFGEGFGVVAMEAMSHGVPVIATTAGGLGWVIEDDVSGIVVQPGDVEGLRDAIIRLRDDPQLRARYGEGGRRRARERFGWDHVNELTLDAYRQALRGS